MVWTQRSAILVWKCKFYSTPNRWVLFRSQMRRQLVKIKDCWKPFGLMKGIINITGAWKEVTNYIKSSWKKLQLEACYDLKGFEENKTAIADVPCREHISIGSMLKWAHSGPNQLAVLLSHLQEGILYSTTLNRWYLRASISFIHAWKTLN